MLHHLAVVSLVLSLGFSPRPDIEAPESSVEASHQEVRYEAEWEAHLRAERAERMADLRAYAEAGRFPQKPGVPGWHHQFLDASGIPCAVASLIMTSGHADLVRAQAVTDNGVVVSDLESGPLVDWVLTSGLTMEEIAVIQVPGFQPFREGPSDLPSVDLAQVAEQERIRTHLSAVLSLLEADTEASIWKAMSRLHDEHLTTRPAPAQG